MSETFESRHRSSILARTDFLRALRVTLWVGPGLMALVGVGYMLFEHQRRAAGSGLTWTTVLGIGVFGILGPGLSWVYLRWAIKAADAFLGSQRQLERRADELATLNQLSVAASHSLDLDTTLISILEQTMEALDAAAGMVFIQEDGRGALS